MTLRKFKELKYGDRIKREGWRGVYTVIEPFGQSDAAVRLAWHGQTFLISNPLWWSKLPDRGPK